MKRVVYGFILFLIIIAAMAAGGVCFALVLAAAAVMGGREYVALARFKGMKPSGRIVVGMIIAFFVVASLPTFPGVHLSAAFSLEHFPLLFTIGLCISFTRLLFRHEQPPATIADIATTVMGFIYVGWLPSHLVLLRNVQPPGIPLSTNPLEQPGLAYVWAAMFAILATDVFAYICGKSFGKTPLYPAVSPKKTVEGAVGGFLAAIFWCTFVFYVADNYSFASHPFHYKWWQGILMGAAVSIACQLGDLAESLMKRDAGVKDSSAVIPGHGGFLDRGDGMIFGSAIAYYFVMHFVVGML